jgi:hypothetical protein
MHINWSGLIEVFLIALIAGVGLVVLFSFGIVALDRRSEPGQSALATTVATACFLACAAMVGYGIYLVVAK